METIEKAIKKRVRKPAGKKASHETDDKISISLEALKSKAYELFEQRGFQHGYDQQDWFEAERAFKSNP